MGAKEFFKPNVLKVIMAILLIAISFEMLMWNFIRVTTPFILIFPIIIGYFIACVIDYFIKNRVAKIIIAVILAIIAIIFGWFSLARNIVVCDPVHNPGGDPMVFDPVHQP